MASFALAGVHLGDVPTWLAVFAATGAALIALRQLRSQQSQIVRQTLALERQQADKIDVSAEQAQVVFSHQDGQSRPYWIVTVANTSGRPIRFVRAAFVELPRAGHRPVASAVEDSPGSSMRLINTPTLALIRAGTTGAILFSGAIESHPANNFRYRTCIQFEDDAHVPWQIDIDDLHLQRLDHPDSWLPKATPVNPFSQDSLT